MLEKTRAEWYSAHMALSLIAANHYMEEGKLEAANDHLNQAVKEGLTYIVLRKKAGEDTTYMKNDLSMLRETSSSNLEHMADNTDDDGVTKTRSERDRISEKLGCIPEAVGYHIVSNVQDPYFFDLTCDDIDPEIEIEDRATFNRLNGVRKNYILTNAALLVPTLLTTINGFHHIIDVFRSDNIKDAGSSLLLGYGYFLAANVLVASVKEMTDRFSAIREKTDRYAAIHGLETMTFKQGEE